MLSQRTVARHITNLYGKIGARGKADATAYDFANSFDYSQRPREPVRMTNTPIPRAELLQIAGRRPPVNDPT